MPKLGPLSKQNIKDRYYGVDDPVAEKILDKMKERRNGGGGSSSSPPSLPSSHVDDGLTPPKDKTVVSFWVVGVPETGTQEEEEGRLRHLFNQYGRVKGVACVRGKKCAIIQFVSRDEAEQAMDLIIEGGHGRAVVKFTTDGLTRNPEDESIMRVRWGKSKLEKKQENTQVTASPSSTVGQAAAAAGLTARPKFVPAGGMKPPLATSKK